MTRPSKSKHVFNAVVHVYSYITLGPVSSPKFVLALKGKPCIILQASLKIPPRDGNRHLVGWLPWALFLRVHATATSKTQQYPGQYGNNYASSPHYTNQKSQRTMLWQVCKTRKSHLILTSESYTTRSRAQIYPLLKAASNMHYETWNGESHPVRRRRRRHQLLNGDTEA